jgi:hypothetical protein
MASDAGYDVFISYARADSARARLIRDSLAALGLNVFFDAEGIETGEDFPEIIDRAVKGARCVLGLWSRNAFAGRWVRIESRIGLDQNKLVAATLDAMRPEELPAEFYNVNVASLADYGGQPQHEGWTRIVRGIGKRVGRSDLAETPIAAADAAARTGPTPRQILALAGAGAALVIGAALTMTLSASRGGAAGPAPAFAGATEEAAPAFAGAAEKAAPALPASAIDMSGAWTGAYSENGRETRFDLDLRRGAGGAFAGSVSEPDIYGIIGGSNYSAQVNGVAAPDGSVRFTKTYGAGAAHLRAVVYEGRLSADGRSLAGSWDTGVMHGVFHMERR